MGGRYGVLRELLNERKKRNDYALNGWFDGLGTVYGETKQAGPPLTPSNY